MYARALLANLASNYVKTCPRLCQRAASTSTAPGKLSTASGLEASKGDTTSESSKDKDKTIILENAHKPSLKQGKANPINTVLLFVPQEEAWVVERMGKFRTVLHAGRHILLPFVDKIRYVQSLKEIIIEVPSLNVITSEGVSVKVVSVLHVTVTDPKKASYGTDDPEFASVQIAQTIMSTELSKIQVHQLISQKEVISEQILEKINKSMSSWGITCVRFSIRELNFPEDVQEALHHQLLSERQKETARLDSKAAIESELSRAESKQRLLLKYLEARTNARYHDAKSEAAAILTLAEARAKELEIMSKALSNSGCREAAAIRLAENFVAAICKSRLCADSQGIAEVPDVPRTVAEAMEIYDKVTASISRSADGDEEYFSDREGREGSRQ